MKVAGILLVLVGAFLLVGAALIGVPFIAVFLKGFFGTSGREAGGELLMMLVLTAAALGIAIALIKTGQSLRRRASENDRSE